MRRTRKFQVRDSSGLRRIHPSREFADNGLEGERMPAPTEKDRGGLDGSRSWFGSRGVSGPERTGPSQAERDLEESRAEFKTLFESVETGILLIDQKTHELVDANLVASEMVGLPREKIAGCLCHRFVCPADEGRCPVTDLGQSVDNSERILLTANGERRAIIKTVRPVTISGRALLLESFIDITQRKQAETALRESEQRYRDTGRNSRQHLRSFFHHQRGRPRHGAGTGYCAIGGDGTPQRHIDI
jgi:PAS domain S-box-containing protein